jgi:glycosyltransferase involved in cell wall biosynthesis
MMLYVEVTHTVRSEMRTGIPRVVKNVVKNLLEIGIERHITVVPTILHRGSFVVTPTESVIERERRDITPGPRTRTRSAAARMVKKCMVWFYEKLYRKQPIAELVRAAPNEHHVLLLLDASWPYNIWPAVELLRGEGVRIISVIYDLIPITHSHTVVETLAHSFRRWMSYQARSADGVICISRTMASIVQEHLLNMMQALGESRTLPVLSFYLGGALDECREVETIQEKVLALQRIGSAMFLMVGTIEPRKNHRQVLEAFKKLWITGVDARLIIVGREQWKSEELLVEMAELEEAGRALVLIRNASDSDLKWLYENSSALIMASEVEGFGLPIAEARQAGLPIICSDIPVFLEVGGSEVRAFRVGDVDDLVRAISGHLESNEERTRRKYQWITWRESTEQLVQAITALVE